MYQGLEVVTDGLCLVGESPIWLKKTRELAYVDIRGKRIRKIQMDSGKIRDVNVSQMVSFLVETQDGALIGGAQDGIYEIGRDGEMLPLNNQTALKGVRYNDGKAGPDGRLYMGTFSRDFTAAFYRMDWDGAITELFDQVGNSNGLDWDAGNALFYYCDTMTGRTDAFDFDPEQGSLRNRREVIRYPKGAPDGMTIDEDGNLWTALWGGSSVVCVNPREGRILRTIELPVSQPSCCAFAGDNLEELIITSAAAGVSLYEEPLAGAVFKIRAGVRGREGFCFRKEC